MRSWAEIVAEVEARRSDRQPVLDNMQDVAARYRGDYVIPFPGSDENAQLPPMAPAIIADIIDHTAMSAASVTPQIMCPAIDASKEQGKRSREYARIRGRALHAIWGLSGMDLLLRKAYRQLVGYGTFAMMVCPDFKDGYPRIELRDPLSAFPEPRAHSDLRPPSNCAFVNSKSADWILARFPQIRRDRMGQATGEALWDIVEWIDEDEIVFGLLGPREAQNRYSSDTYVFPNQELARYHNPTGMAGVICPSRVSLEDIAGQVKNIIGQVDLLNRLMALDVVASEKLIFPDRYIIGNTVKPKVNNGAGWRQGWDPEPNIIMDATSVGVMPGSVDPQGRQLVDRVERNTRISGGGLPQFGGETFNSLRTGRGMDSMSQMALEPRIQELHEIMQFHLAYLNEATIACTNGHWPSKKFSLYSGVPGDLEVIEFTPSVHFETGYNTVAYPVPGANKQVTTAELSQQLGAGAISMRDYRLRHPDIRDPETVEAQVNLEAMEEAVRQLLQQGIAQGTLAIEDVINAADEIKQGRDLFETFRAVQQAAQERQATLAEEATEQQAAAPETLDGINPPGAGGAQPPGGFTGDEPIGPNEDQSGLFRLMGAVGAGMNA